MSNTLVCFKIKSLKFPDKKWDNIRHFIFTTQDRNLEKIDKQERQKFDYNTKWSNAGSVGFNFLDESKQNLYLVIYSTDELIDFSYNIFYKAHQDKQIWEVEKILNIKLDIDKNIEPLMFDLFNNACEKILKQIDKMSVEVNNIYK